MTTPPKRREWAVSFLRNGKPIFGFITQSWPDRKSLEKQAKERWDCDEVDIQRMDT